MVRRVMVRSVGGAATIAVAAAGVLGALGCVTPHEGRVGVEIEREVPGVGTVRGSFGQDWSFWAEAGGLCGCVWFLGPDGLPLEGAPVGRIQGGEGGGVVPAGAVGWRVVLSDEDCETLDCDRLGGAATVAEALASLYPGAGPRRAHVVLGTWLLGAGELERSCDLGSWERSMFLDVSATVEAPSRGIAATLLELHLEGGDALLLPPVERAALASAVTVHEAVTLDPDGRPAAPDGIRGALWTDHAPTAVQVVCNGVEVGAGLASPGPTGSGPLALGFSVPIGQLDADPSLQRGVTNGFRFRSKRPGAPPSEVSMKLRWTPSDGS